METILYEKNLPEAFVAAVVGFFWAAARSSEKSDLFIRLC